VHHADIRDFTQSGLPRILSVIAGCWVISRIDRESGGRQIACQWHHRICRWRRSICAGWVA